MLRDLEAPAYISGNTCRNRFSVPVTPLTQQHLISQAAKQHVVWARDGGMIFEALALEVLHCKGAFGRLLLEFAGQRIAEDRQTAILAPIFIETTADAAADARHVPETDLVVLG